MNPFSMQIEYWSRNELKHHDVKFILGEKQLGEKNDHLWRWKAFVEIFNSQFERKFSNKSPQSHQKKKPFKLKSKSKNIETVSLESKNAHWKEKTWQFTSIWMMTKKKRKRKKLLHWLEGQAKEARSWALREDLKKLSKP